MLLFCFAMLKRRGKSGEKGFNDAANGFSILIIITKRKSSNFPFCFSRLKNRTWIILTRILKSSILRLKLYPIYYYSQYITINTSKKCYSSVLLLLLSKKSNAFLAFLFLLKMPQSFFSLSHTQGQGFLWLWILSALLKNLALVTT